MTMNDIPYYSRPLLPQSKLLRSALLNIVVMEKFYVLLLIVNSMHFHLVKFEIKLTM